MALALVLAGCLAPATPAADDAQPAPAGEDTAPPAPDEGPAGTAPTTSSSEGVSPILIFLNGTWRTAIGTPPSTPLPSTFFAMEGRGNHTAEFVVKPEHSRLAVRVESEAGRGVGGFAIVLRHEGTGEKHAASPADGVAEVIVDSPQKGAWVARLVPEGLILDGRYAGVVHVT